MDLDDDSDSDSSSKGRRKRRSSASEERRRGLVIMGSVLLMLVGGFTSIYFTGLLDPLLRDVAIGDEQLDMSVASFTAPKPGFLDLPEIMVNINAGNSKPMYLKIRLALELEDENDIARVNRLLPRVIDDLQVYMRELRTDDMTGAPGMFRMRKEMLARVSRAVGPVAVKDVLFNEIMVQ